jgi:hypothetical protein
MKMRQKCKKKKLANVLSLNYIKDSGCISNNKEDKTNIKMAKQIMSETDRHLTWIYNEIVRLSTSESFHNFFYLLPTRIWEPMGCSTRVVLKIQK